MAPAFFLTTPHVVVIFYSRKVDTTAMLVDSMKAKIFNTTISNLRKNLSEGDFGLWQGKAKAILKAVFLLTS